MGRAENCRVLHRADVADEWEDIAMVQTLAKDVGKYVAQVNS